MLTPDELPSLLAGLSAGLLTGGCYFGGLWWTVRRLPSARSPRALYLASLVVRMALLLLVCRALLTGWGWPSLLAAVPGLALARILLVHLAIGRSAITTAGMDRR